MRHRKLCLGQFWVANLEEIAGYFEKFSVQKWFEQDFFIEFGCFWYKSHQIPLKYPDMTSVICYNFYSKGSSICDLILYRTQVNIKTRILMSLIYPDFQLF